MRITEKAWFGPKKYLGWGWRPVSWEGWVTTLVFVGLAIATLAVSHRSTAGIIAVLVLLGVFYVVALLTGDPAGGPRV